MEPRRASELPLESALVELSTREPRAQQAACLVVQCYLPTLPPAHARAQIFTPITLQHHLAPHNPPADYHLLHIGIILPKKST